MTLFAADITKSYEKDGLSDDLILDFQNLIWVYYKSHQRPFPWRETRDPYHIFISEFMLQQTQTLVVKPKYLSFLSHLPTFSDLANATMDEVLKLWQGLGYNRRAIWMKSAAELIMKEFDGSLPRDPEILEKIKGIGHATAREMVSFAYNLPTTFIETNIRRVFLHFFFYGKSGIHDNNILVLVDRTVEKSNPREWYYALMDYGVMLKKNVKPDPNHRSIHYKKQSKFEGSTREIRGMILRMKISNPTITIEELSQKINQSSNKVRDIVMKMEEEGFFMDSNKKLVKN